MTTTGDSAAVPPRRVTGVPDAGDMRDWAAELVDRARSERVELTGDGGLLTALVRQVLQMAQAFAPVLRDNLDDWDPCVIDGIAAERRVIAFDNRGVGASGGKVPHRRGDGPRRHRVHPGTGPPAGLFGFSLGGGVAQMVALQEPGLVRRMVLAGTGPRGGEGIDEILKVAARAYLGRLKEWKTGRDKRISCRPDARS